MAALNAASHTVADCDASEPSVGASGAAACRKARSSRVGRLCRRFGPGRASQAYADCVIAAACLVAEPLVLTGRSLGPPALSISAGSDLKAQPAGTHPISKVDSWFPLDWLQ